MAHAIRAAHPSGAGPNSRKQEQRTTMDLTQVFLSRYSKEFDYYEEVSHLVARRLEASLNSEGIRAIVTSRAKAIGRLEDKLKKREPEKNYSTIDQIYADIVDLAGVRVALYFPGDRETVGSIIARLFDEFDEPRLFPRSSPQNNKRFAGYAATHYRVRLRASDFGDAEKRYASANVEIQVASVLMHAWSEVEHDLAYKPLSGELSDREYSLLDQLNGLVLAGEIALEQLQQAGRDRVAESHRPFSNHYELATHLLAHVDAVDAGDVSTSGMGRIDLLFELIRLLNLGTPERLQPYLDRLHGDFERRPLAEQVIDAVLAEDDSRYEIYQSIQAGRGQPREAGAEFDAAATAIGKFLHEWIRLERILRDTAGPQAQRRVSIPTGKHLVTAGLMRESALLEFENLRQVRNLLVHGVEVPDPDQLHEASVRLENLVNEIERERPPGDHEGQG